MQFVSKAALLTLLSSLISFSALATEQAPNQENCREESLVKFISGGKEVESKLIGAADPCDQFGGNEAFTPVYGIRVYVNFNLATTVDLDLIDSTFAAVAPNDPELRERLRAINIAVVNNNWIKKTHLHDLEASLNFARTTLFISEKAVTEGRLGRWLEALYSSF